MAGCRLLLALYLYMGLALSRTHVVEVTEHFFPQILTVSAGDSVLWRWNSTSVHTVAHNIAQTSFEGESPLVGFHSGEAKEEGNFLFQFFTEGKYFYRSAGHSFLSPPGEIVVNAAQSPLSPQKSNNRDTSSKSAQDTEMSVSSRQLGTETILVLQPSIDTVWNPGAIGSVEWATTGIPSDNEMVVVLTSDAGDVVLNDSLLNSVGRYDHTVGDHLYGNYRIRVVWKRIPTYSNVSSTFLINGRVPSTSISIPLLAAAIIVPVVVVCLVAIIIMVVLLRRRRSSSPKVRVELSTIPTSTTTAPSSTSSVPPHASDNSSRVGSTISQPMPSPQSSAHSIPPQPNNGREYVSIQMNTNYSPAPLRGRGGGPGRGRGGPPGRGRGGGPGTPRGITKDEKWNINYNDITLEMEVGRGGNLILLLIVAYGVVFKGSWRSTPVAVKKMITEEMSPGDLAEFHAESQLMASLRPHSNVLQLLGMCQEPLALVTEYLPNGNLSSYLQKHRSLDPKVRLSIVTGIARGMLHLHCENIIHRAARNILLTNALEPKISDFGYSRKNQNEDNVTKSTVGPLRWMAPECILDSTYGIKSDVWAYGNLILLCSSEGVTLIEIYTHNIPFPEMDGINVATKVANGAFVPSWVLPEWMEPVVAELLTQVFAFYPEDRPDFGYICQILEANFS